MEYTVAQSVLRRHTFTHLTPVVTLMTHTSIVRMCGHARVILVVLALRAAKPGPHLIPSIDGITSADVRAWRQPWAASRLSNWSVGALVMPTYIDRAGMSSAPTLQANAPEVLQSTCRVTLVAESALPEHVQNMCFGSICMPFFQIFRIK